MTLSVGKEILSRCTKCKQVLAHIILTMKSQNAVGKVKCKTCEATHNYRKPAAARTQKRQASKTSPEAISDMWLEAMSKSEAQGQDYSITTKFTMGDIIDHPKFGPGIVTRLLDQDKIQILFRHQIKVFIHNKSP